MNSKSVSAVDAGGTHRLGNVVTGQVFDYREISPSTAEYQTIVLCRRTRLRPETARVIASLAFGSAA